MSARHESAAPTSALPRPAATSAVERGLLALGVEPALLDAVLGDLAEERAERTARDGALSATLWFAGETTRTAPHLALATVRHLARHDRGRLARIVGVAAVGSLGIAAVIQLRDRPPARIASAMGPYVILNSRHAVRLPVSVRDDRGRPLDSAAVRFAWLSGVPLRMNTHGDVTCSRAGDARVQATLDGLTTALLVRCRPVDELLAGDLDIVEGDPPSTLPMMALDARGRRVELLAGRMTFDDSSVATFVNGSVVPRAAGSTLLEISIGDERARVGVHVHARAASIDALRDAHTGIAVPVRLPSGGTLRLPLPRGTYQLWVREGDETRPIRLAVLDARCGPGDAPLRLVCNSRGESSLVLYRSPGAGSDGDAQAELLARRVPDSQRLRLTQLPDSAYRSR